MKWLKKRNFFAQNFFLLLRYYYSIKLFFNNIWRSFFFLLTTIFRRYLSNINEIAFFLGLIFIFIFLLQVSTGNGIMSHFVNLHIVVPEAFILGSGEHHVDTGSTISLVCMIEKVSTVKMFDLNFLFFFYNS